MIPHRAQTVCDLIGAASPVAMENRMREVAKRTRRWKRWLTNDHPYNKDVVGALKADNVNGPKLGEYIASSAPLHLADGWNYLSRAFDATVRGDRGSAYHLAYYAELRAAMSLLAAEGIGIFNNRHIAINDKLEPTEFLRGTHFATWETLSAWASKVDKAEKLLHAITIESKSLSEWLQSVGVIAPSRQLVAKEWLKAWSIDLQVFAGDSKRRNDMSYRPTRIRVPAPQAIDPQLEMAKPIFDSWAQLEPEIVGAISVLDLTLLRQALELVVREGLCNYASLDQALGSLKQNIPTATFQALETESRSATAVLRAAEIKDFQGKPATPILARALLMLRLASARAASLLAASGVSKEDLQFWWSALGRDLGLWDNPDDIETFSDLWADVGEARDNAEAQISTIQGGSSVREIGEILAQDTALTQFSRAPMWLLGLD